MSNYFPSTGNGAIQVIRVHNEDGEEGNTEEVIEIGSEQAQQLLELDGSTVELMMDDSTDLTHAMTGQFLHR